MFYCNKKIDIFRRDMTSLTIILNIFLNNPIFLKVIDECCDFL